MAEAHGRWIRGGESNSRTRTRRPAKPGEVVLLVSEWLRLVCEPGYELRSKEEEDDRIRCTSEGLQL